MKNLVLVDKVPYKQALESLQLQHKNKIWKEMQ